MAVFSVVFERQGEGSGEVNGLAHVGPRPLGDNQDRVHATTWRRAAKRKTLYVIMRGICLEPEPPPGRNFGSMCRIRLEPQPLSSSTNSSLAFRGLIFWVELALVDQNR